MTPKSIAKAYETLFGLPNVTIEEPSYMIKILDLYTKGMDFGDALHLLSSKNAQKFLSFDKKFINKANKLGYKHVILAE